jgi:sister-chromatid-cohesion protein PDS5
MFKSHVTELVIVMGDKKNERLSEAALKALAAVSKADDTAVPEDK